MDKDFGGNRFKDKETDVAHTSSMPGDIFTSSAKFIFTEKYKKYLLI